MAEFYHRIATKDMLERLSEVAEFAEANVTFIEQDAGNVLSLIEQAAAECLGPVVIIAVDEISNNPPAVEVTVTLNIREHVPTNRENVNFLTAMDVGVLAARHLDGEIWRFMSASQKSPEDGILEVNATFEGMVG